MPRNQGTSRKGKPKKNDRAAGMGRALQKAKGKRHTPSASTGGMAMRQGVENINIHEDETQNRASVLDVNDLDDFLIQAEMANREFASERERFVVLDETAQEAQEEAENKQQKRNTAFAEEHPESTTTQNINKTAFAFQELSVPRRPPWDETTTPEQLDQREKEAFLDWRRAIAKREEEVLLKTNTPLGVTPFEKNIEIWRQLWRVMERSSCIVQVVDARNPLFYLSKDLKAYATQELGKPMLLLINKSDYLTSAQRQAWHDYLSEPDHCWEHVFFSAHDEQERLDRAAMEEHAAFVAENERLQELAISNASDDETGSGDEEEEDKEVENLAHEDQSKTENHTPTKKNDFGIETPLTREELLDWLLDFSQVNKCEEDPKYHRVPFGMVGFPNVGKSSVINVLMGSSKQAHGVVRVGVAAQPGKTKHFQTLLLPDRENMLLCDCPGLVFPSFVNNTADLIAAGVYPIAQMRDPWPVVTLLCKRIPREILNAQYGIQIPMPSADAMLEVEDGTIPSPTAEEFLTTYCVARSMLASSSGVPDFQRASRFVIKDYAVGKLLFCHPPPTADPIHFQKETLVTAVRKTKKLREKLGLEENDLEDETPELDGTIKEEPEIDEDDMLLELMGGAAMDNPNDTKNQNKPGKKKKWGKKGRKLRNKDPYGCHATPESMLGEDSALVGVTVKGGKYSRKGYVRPTSYGGTTRTAA